MDRYIGAKAIIKTVMPFAKVEENVCEIVVFAEFGGTGRNEKLF
jgi:hypothetical protein